MNKIDFTHAGGFPLTQEGLDYLQQSYTECINALTVMGGDGTTPVIINGMEQTISGSSVTINDGWFFYNNELCKFTGGTIILGSSDVALVQISIAPVSLTYNDGSVYPAMINKSASLVASPAVTDASHFPYSSMQLFQSVFGSNARESSWNSIAVSTPSATGGVVGTLYYKKNLLTNTLQIRGTLTANNALNLAASPAASNISVATLPSGYIPNNIAYFTSYFFAANLFKDDLGVSWVKHLTSAVNTGGNVYVNFIKPDSAITAYSIVFNTIIPLD